MSAGTFQGRKAQSEFKPDFQQDSNIRLNIFMIFLAKIIKEYDIIWEYLKIYKRKNIT
jgi:hypothetical protein